MLLPLFAFSHFVHLNKRDPQTNFSIFSLNKFASVSITFVYYF